MWNYLALLLIAAVSTSLSEARNRRSVGSMTLRATPRVAVLGLTDGIRLDCRPAPTVKNVLMAVLIHLERLDVNGTVLIASQRINTLEIPDENRTTADGYLQTDKHDKESFLTVNIKSPTLEDDGVYQCRFAFIDVDWGVHTLGAKVNVTVTELPPPHYTPASDCDCDNVWTEIEKLKAALAARPEQTVQPAGSVNEKCRVSFSARFASRHGNEIRAGKAAIFNDVISSKGGAYDTSTGAFSAPCDGQYFFTLTLRSHQARDSGYVDGVIAVDNEPKARTSVFIDAPLDNYQTATNGVVLNLKSGQKVTVLVKATSSGEFVGEEYSVFSGFYLFP
ncbi:hypothetical protein BsWGS_17075 [Bradybaena similaris]